MGKIIKNWHFWILLSIAIIITSIIMLKFVDSDILRYFNAVGTSILIGIILVFVIYGLVIFPIKSFVKWLKDLFE